VYSTVGARHRRAGLSAAAESYRTILWSSSLTAQLAFRVPTTIARTSARTALDRKVVAAAGIGSGNRHVQEFSGYGASLYVRRYSCSHSNDRCRLIAGVHARRVRQTAYSWKGVAGSRRSSAGDAENADNEIARHEWGTMAASFFFRRDQSSPRRDHSDEINLLWC